MKAKARFDFIVPNEHKTLVEDWFRKAGVILEIWDYSIHEVLAIARCTKATFDAFADYAAGELKWVI